MLKHHNQTSNPKTKEQQSETDKNVVQIDEEQLLAGKLYDSQDILQLFHISTRTLRNWREKGIIRYIKIGNKVYFPAAWVEEILQRFKKG